MPTNRRITSGAAASAVGGKSGRNEGEGNKTAARRFNAAEQKFVRAGKVPAAAAAARRAVDGAEGVALRGAEAAGKRKAAGKRSSAPPPKR